MRATLTNPGRPKRRRRRNANAGGGQSLVAINNAFLRGMVAGMKSNPKARRRTRRNVPMPVVYNSRGNPLILENPPRRAPARRRRRSNPRMTLRGAMEGGLWVGGGSLAGTMLNVYALNSVEDMWIRNGARIATAVASTYAKNRFFGGALAGAALYPFWQEMFAMILGPEAVGTEDMDVLNDGLGQLEADLNEQLDELNREDVAA